MNKHLAVARALLPRTIRNWLRTPAKSLRYLSDRAAYARGALSQVGILDDWTLHCHPAARAHFVVFRTDRSQAAELSAFFEFASPGMRLLDIGAHYRFFALAALKAGGPEAKVLCIEPSSRALNILRANLKANGANHRVQLLNAAMGTADGELRMLTTGPAGADYLVVPNESRTDTVIVNVRSIESVLKETGFRPTHIKLDIESYEFELIEAAAPTLFELKPVLYLELHGTLLKARGKDPGAVIRNLRKAEFNHFLSDGQPTDERRMAACQFDCRLVCKP